MRRAVLLLLFTVFAANSQYDHQPGNAPPSPFGSPPDAKLPNGKSQLEAILKQDHERDLKDAAQLSELAQSFEEDVRRQDSHVLALGSLKKLEEIGKLAHRIQARMKH